MTRTEALDALRLELDKARFSVDRANDAAAINALIEALALLTDIVEAVAGPEK